MLGKKGNWEQKGIRIFRTLCYDSVGEGESHFPAIAVTDYHFLREGGALPSQFLGNGMKRLILRLLPLLSVLVLIFSLLAMSGSGLVAKKVLAHLLMPAGLIWLGLLFLANTPGIGGRQRSFRAFLWFAYTLSGSPYLGNGLLAIHENPFYASETLAEPLDALVVLGGGTSLTPGGNPSVGLHGDRILKPAQLFLAGNCRRLITTGRSVTERGEDRLLSQETSLLWQSLGIPVDAIAELSQPRNTAEEMLAVAELLKAHPEWEKVGLATSASHLPRALDEARKHGLELIPVPCDFRSTALPLSPLYIVPQARGFRDVQTALWEWLGRAAS